MTLTSKKVAQNQTSVNMSKSNILFLGIDSLRADHCYDHKKSYSTPNFDQLIKKGYVEYIYPGEEILLCPSIEHLQQDRHDFTKRWTHCDIEQTLFGLAALVGPFLNRNQYYSRFRFFKI